MFGRRAGLQQGIDVHELSARAVVGASLAPFLLDEMREGRAEDPRGRRSSLCPVSSQAALDSIWVTLLKAASLISMRRGFIVSGISRCRSITSTPFSKRAPLTSTDREG